VIPSAAARIVMRLRTGASRAAAGVTAAALLSSALAVPAAAHPRTAPSAASDEDEAPLAVSIESISPSTLPARGDVALTGEITNRSESTWTELRAYLFMSSTPMTTSEELEEATASPEALDVGRRITDPGLYDEVADLEPGQSTRFTLSVPRSELPVDGPGVYWLGVHVLGTNEEGRIDGADGRARTFIPSMPARGTRTDLSLLVPLRGHVRRTSEGRLANITAWNRRLGVNGRLSRLLGLAGTSSDVPFTWIVDPAVLEAVRSISDGNPGFDLEPTDPGPDESASPDGGPTEAPDPADPGDSDDDPAEELAEVAADAQQARDWLADFTDLASGQSILTLPYGDVDAATMLRGNFAGTFERAYELSTRTMEEFALEGTPVVAPANGLFPNAALQHLDPGRTLLLSSSAVNTDATTVALPQGTEAVLTDDVARVGGPGPTPPFAALALRQQILAEAAVRGLTGSGGRPLVVSLPELWNPGGSWAVSDFFGGLDVPWIRPVLLSSAQATSRTEEYDERLNYRGALRRREIPVANVVATQELDDAGSTLADLLTRNDTIDDQVGRAAMLGSSTNARQRAVRALTATQRISFEVNDSLSSVYVEGTPLVTMSSESGSFQVTVVNELEEPVTVGITAETGTDELQVRSPDLVSLGPGQRASVRLGVTATDTGVHSVRIVPTTRDGRPLGRTTQVKVRSSQVGLVIWLIMGTGAVVFFAAIAARILRRVRAKQKAEEPQLEDVTS